MADVDVAVRVLRMSATPFLQKLVKTRRQRAMFLFLCADAAFFFTLFTAYIYVRVQSPTWPVAIHFGSALLAAAMTLFVGAGSFTMASAAKQQDLGETAISVRLIASTVALWGTFLLLDAMEWARLVLFEHVTPTHNPWNVPPFGATFFALTGFHALHMVVGFFYMIAVAANIKRSDVGACALFIHFSNLVWFLLFASLYVFAADMRGL